MTKVNFDGIFLLKNTKTLQNLIFSEEEFKAHKISSIFGDNVDKVITELKSNEEKEYKITEKYLLTFIKDPMTQMIQSHF